MNPSVLISNFETISTIVGWVSTGAGFCLLVSAMFKFKRYGESRTMMSSQMSMSGPLFTLIAGVALVLLPRTLEILVGSIWGDGQSLLIMPAGSEPVDQYMVAIYKMIQIVGIVSIIRGIITLSKLGGGQGQPGMMGKAFGFIIGGAFCLNIQGTIALFKLIFNLSL